MSYIYLASPYSHNDAEVRKKREEQISQIGYILMKHGYNLFCPITQSHRLAEVGNTVLEHEDCMRVDLAFLEKADALFVVQLYGWIASKGVQEEIEFAEKNNIPIYYVTGNRSGLLSTKLFIEDRNEQPLKGWALSIADGFGNLEDVIVEDKRIPKKVRQLITADDSIIPGVKDASGKAQLRYVPYAAEEAIARGRAYGNKKYKDPAKWYQHADALEDFVEAARRHIGKYQDAVLYKNRPVLDEESGLHHLDHAITSLALAIALRDKPKAKEDELRIAEVRNPEAGIIYRINNHVPGAEPFTFTDDDWPDDSELIAEWAKMHDDSESGTCSPECKGPFTNKMGNISMYTKEDDGGGFDGESA